MKKSKFVIEPHFRLQEWVAEEKGYFKDEGLDYVFQEDGAVKTDGKVARPGRQGRRDADLREGPHLRHQLRLPLDRQRRRLEGPRQALRRCLLGVARGIFVPADSPVQNAGGSRRRADLGRLPVGQPLLDDPGARAVHAGATRSTCRSTTACCSAAWSCCSTARCRRATLFSGPYYFAEQLGFRKVIDTTFMIATMMTGDPDPEDVQKFFRALKRAQRDIDLRPELYTHYYKKEFPKRFHAMMDTRRWGPGERIVFEPYTKEVFEETFEWIADHGIFADTGMGTERYESSIMTNAG